MADKIFYTAAACCAAYFVMVAVYTGMASKFHLIWLCFAGILLLLGILAARQQAGAIQIPLWLRAAFGVVCAALFCSSRMVSEVIISKSCPANVMIIRSIGMSTAVTTMMDSLLRMLSLW